MPLYRLTGRGWLRRLRKVGPMLRTISLPAECKASAARRPLDRLRQSVNSRLVNGGREKRMLLAAIGPSYRNWDWSSFAGAGKQDGGRRGTRRRDGPTAYGSRSALQVVSLGQVEQPAPGERVRILGQIARPLREAPIEIFHDATPATSLKALFQSRPDCAVKLSGPSRHSVKLLVYFASSLPPRTAMGRAQLRSDRRHGPNSAIGPDPRFCAQPIPRGSAAGRSDRPAIV